MNPAPRTSHAVCMALSLLASPAVFAQSAAENEATPCRVDELDMGDACVRIEPARPDRDPSLRRITRFPSRSLMPGHVGENTGAPGQSPGSSPPPAPAAAPPQPGTVAEPVTAASVSSGHISPGYGVQFGVFSDQSTARDVARPLADRGLAVGLAPLQRGGRTLWACIHGPFPDEASARSAAERLRIDHRLADTYIKPLDNLELTGLSNDATEE